MMRYLVILGTFWTLESEFEVGPSSGAFRHKKILFELAARWPFPERYRWQKWTFHQKYNHFEKKFSKIDKKFVSQSIIEVHI